MTTGTAPTANSRQALQDGLWLLGLANGQNRSSQTNLVAHAGGTKAAALQIAAAVAFVKFDTVATNGDSALLPQAKAGVCLAVFNNGAATLSLYGRGTDTVNGSATATNYDLTTKQCAFFFCAEDGEWGAIKTA